MPSNQALEGTGVARMQPGGGARLSTGKCLRGRVFDPTAADDYVAIVENGSLAGGERALRLVKRNLDFVRPGGFPCRFNNGRRGLMPVANLHCDSHRLAQLGRRNQVYPASAERARIKLRVLANHDLPRVILDLNHVQRRAGRYTETLALADREVVNSGVLANHFAVCCYHLTANHFARNFRRTVALLAEIGFEKALIVAAGDEADFLRIGLFGNHQLVLAGKFAHLRLCHAAEREQSAAQLLLRKAEEEVRLVFGLVGWALQQPAVNLLVKDDLGIMAGCDFVGANLLRHNKKLVKLQVIVAETAGDRCTPGKILLDERTHHIALKALFVIDHVVGDANGLGNAASIVDIVDRTAAALDGFGHAFVSGETALVPELHGQADDVVASGTQHGRDDRGVNSSRHGDSDGL